MNNNLKYIRRAKEYDLTQSELAEKTGLSQMTIVNIEKGKSPNLETAIKLAKFFKMPVEEIFFE